MITKIEIDGFKSFKDFEMEFTPLTVIAGANASGKSNLFDALQLLSDIAEMELPEAFEKQRGDASELFLKYWDGGSASEMSFAVEMIVDKTIKDNWGGELQLEFDRLRYEISIKRDIYNAGFEGLQIVHEKLLFIERVDNQVIFEQTIGHSSKHSVYQQSILGSVIKVEQNPYIFAAREEMRHWKTIRLNPEDMREPTKNTGWIKYSLSESGKNLAAVLFQLAEEDKFFPIHISSALCSFVKGFVEIQVDYSEITRSYYFKLKNSNGQVFPSQTLSDGTLRLLALCVILYDPDQKGVLCFEEPENGVHPYQIRSVLQLLKKISEPFNEYEQGVSQVIVNTHSPIMVDEAVKWNDHINTGVWFMRMNTLVTTLDNKRVGMRITQSTPVFEEFQSSSNYSEQEQKMTIHDVKQYLNSIRS